MGVAASDGRMVEDVNFNTYVIARRLKLEVDKVKKLKAKMSKLASKEDNAYLLTRKQLKSSMKAAKIVPNNQDVLLMLFTCFEIPELENTVYWQRFLMGICSLVGLTLQDKLAFAMDLFGDITMKAKITKEEFIFIVNSMNDAVEYMQDTAMRKREIKAFAEDVWKTNADPTDNCLDYQDKKILRQIVASPVMIQYLQKAQMRGMEEDEMM